MTRHGPVLYGSGSFPDGNRIGDLAALLRCMPRATDGSPGPQMQQELLFQHAARLHIKATIDGLVRHLAVLGMRPLQPTRDLLGRPIAFQFCCNSLPQLVMPRQLAPLRAPSSIPGSLIRGCGSVRTGATVARDLPPHGRRRPPKTVGDPAQRVPMAPIPVRSPHALRASAQAWNVAVAAVECPRWA